MQPVTPQNNSASVTSGTNISYWTDSIQQRSFDTLAADIECDALVVGAGLAGITTAYCLAKAGRQVVVIDDGNIGSGETGRTTAHVVNALDDFYKDIATMHGEDNATLAADSHTAAINFVESTVNELGIDCDFTRLDGYLFLHPSDKEKTLQDEHDATRKAGIRTDLISGVPGIGSEKGPCLHYPGQSQFHPLKYLMALADYIVANGGKIYTQTHASEFKKNKVTANGYTINAQHIVVATNTPVNNTFTPHTKQFPYRTYVIGGLVPKGTLAYSLWWDTGDQDSKWVVQPYHYVRLQKYNDEYDLLISGGEDHKTAQADTEGIPEQNRYDNLEQWTRQRFPAMKEIVYKWSGQVMEPVDSLAYIGRNPGDDNVYVITGDSGNGMTHCTIGGMLVSDLIQGKKNAWEKLYDPSRVTMSMSSVKDFVEENANTAAQFADYVKAGDIKSQQELHPGEGAVMNIGMHKVCVYKNDNGSLNAYTAICPHLGCILQWNGEEKTFDCPCHGSRFTNEGVVINGPALNDLKKFDIKDA
ncbi:MAG: FAD-dependent oxidoreductase [Bacteroidota bacterium]|nr:FAD-dependent oxidoreductase [Bacteroidota bacterium]